MHEAATCVCKDFACISEPPWLFPPGRTGGARPGPLATSHVASPQTPPGHASLTTPARSCRQRRGPAAWFGGARRRPAVWAHAGAARAFNPAVPRPAEFPQAGQSRRADQGAAVSPGHRQGGRRPALPSRGTRDAPSAAPRTSHRSSPGPSSRRLLCCSRRKRKVTSTGFWVLRHTEMVLFLHLSAAKSERSAVCKHRKRKSHFETPRTLEKTWPALVSELVSPQNQARPPGPPCLEERRARAGQRGPAPRSRGCEMQS